MGYYARLDENNNTIELVAEIHELEDILSREGKWILVTEEGTTTIKE